MLLVKIMVFNGVAIKMEEKVTFGMKLGNLRKNAEYFINGRNYLSAEQFGILVGEYLRDKAFPRDMVSKWETGETIIKVEERDKLCAIISVLHKYSSIATRQEADSFLQIGKYGYLDDDEASKIDPEWLTPDKNTVTEPKFEPPHFWVVPTTTSEIKNPPFLAPSLPVQGVLGRQDEINKILLLFSNQSPDKNHQPVALRGLGGIGKTTLAIAIANMQENKKHYTDGVLWISLGPKPTLRFGLEKWGSNLGIDLIPERDEEGCAERLRSALHNRKILIIIDDVWEIKHGALFLVGGPQSHTILTTREVPVANMLASQERTLPVDVLKPEPALELLRSLAPELVTLDEKSAKRLCEKLEFLPLGLTLAGRFLANESNVPTRMQRLLSELIEKRETRLKLLQDDGRLGVDSDNPVSLQAILGMSVERLSPTDQDRFAMSSFFGGEPLTWSIEGARAVWDCSLEDAEETINQLGKRGLVERREDRYWMHALLADYAEEMRIKRGL